MTAPGQGSKSYWQFGRESTWATAVASTKRIAPLSMGVEAVIKQEKDLSLHGGMVARDIVKVNERAEGQIETYLTYNEQLMLIDALCGTATFGANGGSTTGAGPFTHVFTTKELFNSFTHQLIEGNIPAGKCQRATGSKMVSLELAGEAASIVRATWGVVGKQKETDQTPTGALSAATPLYVLTSHAVLDDGTSDVGGSDVILKSFTFSMQNGCVAREDCGSAYILEPMRAGPEMARLKFRREFRTKVLMDTWIAGTNLAFSLTFTSSPSSFKLEAANSRVVSFKNGIDDMDICYVEAELEAVYTSGSPDYGIKFTVVNAQATITT